MIQVVMLLMFLNGELRAITAQSLEQCEAAKVKFIAEASSYPEAKHFGAVCSVSEIPVITKA